MFEKLLIIFLTETTSTFIYKRLVISKKQFTALAGIIEGAKALIGNNAFALSDVRAEHVYYPGRCPGLVACLPFLRPFSSKRP